MRRHRNQQFSVTDVDSHEIEHCPCAGKIFPRDTYLGFRRIGFNMLLSAYAMFVIHAFLAYPSQDNWIPDPRLPIMTKNIHRDKHGSDSMVYDKEGRYMPVRQRSIFYLLCCNFRQCCSYALMLQG